MIEEDHPIMLGDNPEKLHVPVKAESLVLADARLLNATGRNVTDQRRALVLASHSERLARGCERILRLEEGRLVPLGDAETRAYFSLDCS